MGGYYTDPIRSYRKAQDVMQRKGRMGVRVKGTFWPLAVRLGWSTYLVASDSKPTPAWYGILLHETVVVKFMAPLREDGQSGVNLTTGGWPTLTTLQTMQKYSPTCIGVSGRNIHSSKREANIFVRLNEGDDHDLACDNGQVSVTFAVPNIYE